MDATNDEPADDSVILVGVDGGDTGWDALAWAVAEAAATGQAVRIVHVVAWPSVPADLSAPPALDRAAAAWTTGEHILAEARGRARAVAAGVAVSTQLETGTDPAAAIVRVARSAALIVLGRPRAAGRRRRLLTHSVVVDVLHRASSPVAVVCRSDGRSAAGSVAAGRVAVFVDQAASTPAGRAEACAAADRRGVGVTLLSADALAGPLAPALIAAASGAVLLVLAGTPSRWSRTGRALGALLRSAPAPILIVGARPPAAGHPGRARRFTTRGHRPSGQDQGLALVRSRAVGAIVVARHQSGR